MKADDLLRFERLMLQLLARGPAGPGVENIFRQAVTLAGLEGQVWLETSAYIPRRCDKESAQI
jgi:hypothetical protein